MESCNESAREVLEECSLKIEYREWLTSAQASDYLGISTGFLMNLTSTGRVPYYKLGRSNRYLRSELRELLLSQPRGVPNGNKI